MTVFAAKQPKEKEVKNPLVTTIVILAATGLLVSATVLAQDGPGKGGRDGFRGPPDATQKLAYMSDRLDLTSEQEAEILLILQEHEELRLAAHEQYMESIAPEACAQKQQAEEQILGVLDNEQAELFQEMKQDRESRGGERGKRRGREPLDCSAYETADS